VGIQDLDGNVREWWRRPGEKAREYCGSDWTDTRQTLHALGYCSTAATTARSVPRLPLREEQLHNSVILRAVLGIGLVRGHEPLPSVRSSTATSSCLRRSRRGTPTTGREVRHLPTVAEHDVVPSAERGERIVGVICT